MNLRTPLILAGLVLLSGCTVYDAVLASYDPSTPKTAPASETFYRSAPPVAVAQGIIGAPAALPTGPVVFPEGVTDAAPGPLPSVGGLLKGRQEHYTLEGDGTAWLRGPLRLAEAYLTVYFWLEPNAAARASDPDAAAFYLLPANDAELYRQVYPKAPPAMAAPVGGDIVQRRNRRSGSFTIKQATVGDFYLVIPGTVGRYRVEIFEAGAEPAPAPSEVSWGAPEGVVTPLPTASPSSSPRP